MSDVTPDAAEKALIGLAMYEASQREDWEFAKTIGAAYPEITNTSFFVASLAATLQWASKELNVTPIEAAQQVRDMVLKLT